MLKLENKLVIFFIVISLLLFIFSFLNFSSLNKEKNKLRIVVTNGTFYDFVKNIGGDKVELLNLSFISQGGHIHNVDLLPQDISKLNSADIVLKIGYGLDDWINKYINNPQIKIYELNKGVELFQENNIINPHYWLSIKNAKIIIKNLNNILNSLDKKNSFYYNKKTNDYLTKLNELEELAKNKLTNLDKKTVIITHPAFNYLFKDYNIKIGATIYNDELKDLLPQDILNLGKLIKNEKIEIIFVESGFVTNLVSQIANIYNLKIFSLNPVEVIKENESYYQLMKNNIETIQEALK